MSALGSPAPAVAARALAWCPHCACLDAPTSLVVDEGAVIASCARCSRRFTLGRVVERAATLRLVEPREAPRRAPAGRPTWLPVDLTELELEAALSGEQRGDALRVPEGHCPRCVTPRADAHASCPSCGLDFARVSLEALQPPTWLRERWVRTWARWGDDGLHADLLELATKNGELAALGRLYRLRLAQAPGDALAERARAEVVRRASLPLATPRSDLSTVRRQRLLAGTLGLIVVLVGVVVAMLR